MPAEELSPEVNANRVRARRPKAELGERSVLLVGNFVSRTSDYGSVGEELAAHLEASGWQVARTSYRSRGIAKLADMLTTCWRQRSAYKVAHVEVYSGRAFLWAEAVCELLSHIEKPFVLSLHGGNLPVFLPQWPRRALRLLQSAAAVVCPSPYLKEALRFWRSDVRVVPNALAVESYPRRIRKRAAPTLVWLRAFRSMYLPEVAVEAFAHVCLEVPEAHMTMAGPDRADGSKQRAMEKARQLGVLNRIDFTNGVPKDRVGFLLDKGDIFLNTSSIDNTPVSVMEALCCGLCIVSTDVGGIPFLLEHGTDALLVEPGNPEVMAHAVLRILKEESLPERLSTNAISKAGRFDWSVTLPEWDRLLRSIQTI